MDQQKVLVITYYWPPSGGSGVQRWLKFVKYLPAYGWKPYVFTPENPSFDVRDESLLKDVPPEAEIVRIRIWEPYGAFNKVSSVVEGRKAVTPTAMVSGKRKTLFQRLSTWVRGNMIIPDPRVFWVKPAVRFLHQYIREQQIDRIITTGPPHSMHLIGYRLKRMNPKIRWIADFRDPWSEWGFLDSLMVGPLARAMHRQQESHVLATADDIVTITPFYKRQFERLSGKTVTLLTNGYDGDDFERLTMTRPSRFVVRHVGTVNEKCNPRPFMNVVAALASRNETFRNNTVIDFVGEVHPEFKSFVNASDLMRGLTTFTPPVRHKDLVDLYGSSSVLLIILTGYKDAEGYMPGKLFEYLAAGLPILGTGPADGDAAALLEKSQAGDIFDAADEMKIAEKLIQYFKAWQDGVDTMKVNAGSDYTRRAVAGRLAELLK